MAKGDIKLVADINEMGEKKLGRDRNGKKRVANIQGNSKCYVFLWFD